MNSCIAFAAIMAEGQNLLMCAFVFAKLRTLFWRSHVQASFFLET
jgi:hypothetical protein